MPNILKMSNAGGVKSLARYHDMLAGNAVVTPVINSSLRIWLDASDSSTITASANRVSAISNKAAGYTSFVYANADSASQPLVVANAQAGRQAIQFANSRSDMLYNQTSSPMAGATVLTMFLVAKTTSTGNGYKFCVGSDTSNYSAPLWYQLSQKNYYETGSGGSSTTGTYTTAGVANIQYVYHANNTAKDFRTYIGGTAVETISGGGGQLSVGGATNPYSSIGRGYGATAPPDMYFCEIVLYNAALTAGEIAQNIAYLSAKWGV